jgi:hypothetical protein
MLNAFMNSTGAGWPLILTAKTVLGSEVEVSIPECTSNSTGWAYAVVASKRAKSRELRRLGVLGVMISLLVGLVSQGIWVQGYKE